MKVTLYLSEKPRDAAIGAAIAEGCKRHGHTVALVTKQDYLQPDWETQVAVVVGIRRRNRRIMRDYLAAARHCVLVDKSYFGRSTHLRLSVDGFQPHYLHATPRPDDRWRKLRDACRIEVKPRRPAGGYLVYAGSSQKYCDWHELGDVNEYAKSVCHHINKQTHSEVALHYRPKPGWVVNHPGDVQRIPGTKWSPPEVPFSRVLEGARAVVTHGSNAAVEALIAGVPAVLVSKEGDCAAWPVANHAIEDVLKPRFPDDAERLQWLADLAYCQFDDAELRDGTAWALLEPHLRRQGAHSWGPQVEPLEAVIAQYRALHESPKLFRGASVKGHVEVIAELVARHRPATLLDYGSGKGLQYTAWNVQQAWGGLAPACYDPGVPELSTKPAGPFDGVICTDVMEHVPPEAVERVYAEAIAYARKFAFFCIYTGPARKHLPDGRNCHLTQRPERWWVDLACTITGGTVEGTFERSRPIPGGGYEVFPHWVVRRPDGGEIVLTFRVEE